MIRILIKTLYFMMLTVLICISVLAYLLSTNSGANIIVEISKSYLPGTLSIANIQGTILNNLRLDRISYKKEGLVLNAQSLTIHWNPSNLKQHTFHSDWQQLTIKSNPEQLIKSSSGSVNVTLNWPQIDLNLLTQVSPSAEQNWQIKIATTGSYPWQWTIGATVSPISKSQTKHNGLHTSISLKSVIQSQTKGNFTLKIDPGYYQVPDNKSVPPLEFKGGTISLLLNAQRLSGQGDIEIDPTKLLKLNVLLPQFSLDKGLSSGQRIRGDVTLSISSLDFLQNLSPEVSKLKGQLSATLKASGTIDKPQIEGKISVNQTSMYLPKLGLNLEGINLTLLSKKTNWEASGSILSDGHSLLLNGKGLLSPTYSGELHITGTNIPVFKTNEYQVTVSPQLRIVAKENSYTLLGTVLVPYAQIKPQSFSNSISLPEEVVYKNEKESSNSSTFNTSMDISIELGKEVAIDAKGLKGRLEGKLHIKQIPQGAMNAYGELSVVDGLYKAYGQNLSLKQGQLIFTGGSISNPGINVRAAKKINNNSSFTSASQLFDFNNSNLQSVNMGDSIVLGVEATGRLNKPKIQLFSDPAILSQADILSMLVLGRTASQADKAGGQLLLTAISSMNVGDTNSTKLLDQLKKSSGFDFDVQTNTNYNQSTQQATDSTAFVVGKSLSKRLYLSYNIGLSQSNANMLTLKYILNKFFSIQVSTSDTSNGVDFLYTGSKKK